MLKPSMRPLHHLALCLTPVAAATCYGSYLWETRPVPFERTRWAASERDIGDPRNWRRRMTDDVIRNVVRPGMTLQKAQALLGRVEPMTLDNRLMTRYYLFRYWNPYGLRNLLDDDYDFVVVEYGLDRRVLRIYREYSRG